MIEAWLVYDQEGAARNADYIRYHLEIGMKMNIHFELMMAEKLEKEIPKPYPRFAIVRTISPQLSFALEQKNILVFNSSIVSSICNDKGRTIRLIQSTTSVPVIPTECFLNPMLSKQLLAEYPLHVIKSVDGHGGKQVFDTSDDFNKIEQGISESDFIIQPFVKGPGKDVRVYVIGNQIIGAVERTSLDGFKSNYSLGGNVNTYSLSLDEKQYVNEICHAITFGMVGIDFILNEKGKFIFNEIEDVVGARMLYRCQPDCKLLEKYLTFIIEKLLQSK